jgi:hypothetical protein
MGGKPKKYVNKTQKTSASVDAYVKAVEPERMRADTETLLALMKDVTGHEPAMWGAGIVGFGSYHYLTKSGCEADWPRVGFSSRKTTISVYIMPGFEAFQGLLAKLGPHKHSVSCLYLKRLADVDLDVLRAILVKSLAIMNKRYP